MLRKAVGLALFNEEAHMHIELSRSTEMWLGTRRIEYSDTMRGVEPIHSCMGNIALRIAPSTV